MVLIKNLFFVLCFAPFLVFSQPQDTTIHIGINKKRLRTLVIGSTVFYAGSLTALSELWYKDSKQQSFRFFNDNAEWNQVDKLGHFYTSFYVSSATSRALRWSNVEQSKSNLMGSLTGFLVMVPVEILDGFSNAYGASTGDLLADAGGAAFFYAQTTLWREPRIIPKFSFHQTSYEHLRPNILGDSWSSKLLKDYNGQTYWLSFDMDKFIKFPKWLNLAAGYGAQGMVYSREKDNRLNGYKSFRQYYLSIDIDLTEIKTRSKALKSIFYFISMLKFPAPTLDFSKKGVKFHTLYF